MYFLTRVCCLQCVTDQGFRSMGCRLFDRLSRTSSGVQGFRTILLKKAETDYRAIYNALDLYEEASER